MLLIYRLSVWLITPFIPLYLQKRVRHGKEDANRVRERFGRASLPKPKGKIIWVHAASMGEVQSVLPFIKRITHDYPDIYVLLTTVTLTSAKHFSKQLPERAFHQFAPLDTEPAVRRFLQHWQPQMVFFVDSELWPNMLHGLRRRKIQTILLNGRISEKSVKKWRLARGFCAQMLQSFTLIFAKSETDALRFKQLGAENPLSYGNLKFAATALPVDENMMRELANQIEDRPTWLAASTHAGEEIIAANIHLKLQQKHPHLLTIIAPRHSARGDEIMLEIAAMGLNVAQRSKGQTIDNQTDIYLADTMGEMGLFYRLGEIAFIGGSLVAHGGQNPLEAARLGCAIIYGNHMHNFIEFCEVLEQNEAAICVQNQQQLADVLDDLLDNHRLQQQMVNSALDVVRENQHVMQHILQEIAPMLKQLSG